MPKHGRKGKGMAKPLAVPSLDNKPRYSTPDVQQLPTLEPTPAVKARSRGLPTFEEATNRPLVRAKVTMRSKEDWERERQERKEQVQREQATQEETSALEESDEEECEFQGPWVAKGNPLGFLDSEVEEILDSLAVKHAKMLENALGRDFWRSAAESLLKQMVHFTEEVLVETEPEMKKHDLLLSILDMHGGEMWEGREEIKELIQKAIRERDDNFGM